MGAQDACGLVALLAQDRASQAHQVKIDYFRHI
jgi:hypothetical protein